MKKKIIALLLLGLTHLAIAKDFGSMSIDKRSIVGVYDGDTFFINMPECPPVLCKKIGVRINGIDSPEIRGKCEEEKNLAVLAKTELESKIAAGSSFELKQVKREKYGRILGNFFVDGEDIAASMVGKGFARWYDGGSREGWCSK